MSKLDRAISQAKQSVAAKREREEARIRENQKLVNEVQADDELYGVPVRRSAAVAKVQTANPYDYGELNDASAALSKAALDFLFFFYWLMTYAGYSETLRGFIVALICYVDRNDLAETGAEVTNAELAAFMNCTERTIQRYHAKLKEAMKGNDGKDGKLVVSPLMSLISFNEGDFDKSQQKNRRTRYSFGVLGDLIADAIVAARSTRLYELDYREALRRAALNFYQDEWKRAKGKFKPAMRERRQRVPRPESARSAIHKTLVTKAKNLRKVEDDAVREETAKLDVTQAEQVEQEVRARFRADYMKTRAEADAQYLGDDAADSSLQAVDAAQVEVGGETHRLPVEPVAPSAVLVIVLEKEKGTTTLTSAAFVSSDDLRLSPDDSAYQCALRIPAVARLLHPSRSRSDSPARRQPARVPFTEDSFDQLMHESFVDVPSGPDRKDGSDGH